MRSFEIFRSKDPQVSAWLQNNGYRNGFQEKGEKALQNSKIQEETEVKNKEVKFSIGKYMHSKIPSLASRQTLPELRKNKTAEACDRGHLKNVDETVPVAISSQALKRVVYQEKSEPAQTFVKSSKGPRIRTFSSPQLHNDHAIKGRPKLSRRCSSFSSSSDIPVQIRNNNVCLRKYSCPEHYIPTKILERDQGEDGGLETHGFGKKTLNAATSFTRQLATKSSNQTSGRKSREQSIDHTTQALKGKSILEVKIARVEEKYAERRKDNTVGKDFKNSLFVTASDANAKEIIPNSGWQMSDCSSESSDRDLDFTLYEEDSLQSYSLEVQPNSRRNNFPSSMYSRRGTMLTWLGEVNRHNPQSWS